eukprot:g3526.t1
MLVPCPHCNTDLDAAPELYGHTVQCPACNGKLQIPTAEEAPANTGAPKDQKPKRKGWDEKDHANVDFVKSLLIGGGITVVFLLALVPFISTPIGGIFLARGWVNWAETFLFIWGMTILVMKLKKNQHQARATLLELFPARIGGEIHLGNIGEFIDNIYTTPATLRDSLFVNRIRKALELFEARGDNSEVATFLATQSDIDANRSQSSYSLLKVFLWAIPILGFIGTVMGLSTAVGSLAMGDNADPEALKESINSLTSGLGVAFDTTLLGLILSMLMSFPMAAVQKKEDETLTMIDAFCTEKLLPKLNDSKNPMADSLLEQADSIPQLVSSLARAHETFLVNLNESTKQLTTSGQMMEERLKSHQQMVERTFTESVTKLTETSGEVFIRSHTELSKTFDKIANGIDLINHALRDLGQNKIPNEAKRKKGDGVSLFPFMSILACLIGILTLMISVSMQLKQIDQGRSEEEMARALENRDLLKQAEESRQEIEKLEKDLERDKSTASAMAKLKERKIILRQKLEETEENTPDQTDAELQKQIELMQAEIVSLKRERPPLSQRLAQLQKELEKRENPPESAESVVIQPGGTGIGTASELFFVECNSTGIVIRPENGAPVTVSEATITTNQAYNSFLERVKGTRDSMVLFLVRRSGYDSYRWAAGWAESQFEKVQKFLDELLPATPEEIAESKETAEELEKEKQTLIAMMKEEAPTPEELEAERRSLALLEKSVQESQVKLQDISKLKELEKKVRETRDKESQQTISIQEEIAKLEGLLDETPAVKPDEPTVVNIPNSRPIPNDARIFNAMVIRDRVHIVEPASVRELFEQEFQKNRRDWLIERIQQKGSDRYIYDGQKIVKHFENFDWKNNRGQKIEVISPPTSNRITIVISPDLEKGGTPTEELRTPGSNYSKAALVMSRDFNSVLLFQVSPDSFHTYLEARRLADKAKIAAGWEINGSRHFRINLPDIEVKRIEEPPPKPEKPPGPRPPTPPPIGPKLD